MAWLVPREDLTNAQLRAVELNTQGHKVILGGPGSGKTLVLLHRARHLLDETGIDESRLRIFVYTKVLKQYIISALADLDLPDNCTINFDAWCYNFHRNNIPAAIPMIEGKPNFKAIRENIYNYIDGHNNFKPIYDFIMVDEGQDLDDIAYGILTRISNHITVCMDNNQQLYSTGSSEREVFKYLGITIKSASLLEAYRCSPYIIKLAACMLPEEEQSPFESQSRTRSTDIQTPLLYYAHDWKEEQEHLIEVAKTRIMRNDSLAVLLPNNRMVHGYAQAFINAGIEVETSKNLSFANDKPKILTYHGAKGLTFASILMPRLVNYSFHNFNDDSIRRQIFVGITRAQSWVYLSTVEPQRTPILDRLLPLKDDRFLTVQKHDQVEVNTNIVQQAGNEEDDFFDF